MLAQHTKNDENIRKLRECYAFISVKHIILFIDSHFERSLPGNNGTARAAIFVFGLIRYYTIHEIH